jgi:hypothetical protein
MLRLVMLCLAHKISDRLMRTITWARSETAPDRDLPCGLPKGCPPPRPTEPLVALRGTRKPSAVSCAQRGASACKRPETGAPSDHAGTSASNCSQACFRFTQMWATASIWSLRPSSTRAHHHHARPGAIGVEDVRVAVDPMPAWSALRRNGTRLESLTSWPPVAVAPWHMQACFLAAVLGHRWVPASRGRHTTSQHSPAGDFA